MSLHRRAAQRDANEPQIIGEFVGHHWRVVQHTVYDLDVCCPSCKRIYAVEVKNPENRHKDKRTDSQRQLMLSGWPLLVIETPLQARNLMHSHQRKCLP